MARLRPWKILRNRGRSRGRPQYFLAGLWLVMGWIKALGYILIYPSKAGGRYVLGALASVVLCCGVAVGYFVLSPEQYTSRWSLILPTSSSGTSMQLETIGNAQTIPSSPFGSSSVSPKVIYKEIIDSNAVRNSAAVALGLTPSEFGRPRIKLIDETSIMEFEIKDRNPGQAQRKANALIEALDRQLDSLREDEISRRAKVVETSLTSYRTSLRDARSHVLNLQEETGVLSINQFNEAATTLELMRRRLGELRSELGALQFEVDNIAKQIGIDPAMAAIALKLSSNNSFIKLVSEYADVNAAYLQDSARLGENNPQLHNTASRMMAMAAEIEHLIAAAGVKSHEAATNVLTIMNGTHQADLLMSIVSIDAKIAGKKQEIVALEAQIETARSAIKKMSSRVAQLEDLNKAHLVAEAVFTSAVARLDTNKVDVYASYPMIQILAAPDLPDKPSGPKLLFAILGALLGSLLSLTAWGLAWIRNTFAQKRLKNVSSFGPLPVHGGFTS